MKYRRKKFGFLTKVVRVNWFVAWVNCANEDDCNIILFDVVMGRLLVNVVTYSRTFAWEFNWLLNSIKADWFNGSTSDVPGLPNGDTEILAAGIPPRK